MRLPRLTLLGRSVVLLVGELAINALLWAIAAILFRAPEQRRILSLALIAWTLGLRHGLDSDHICAIDLATRRFISQGRLLVTVGLFFSLGHSTIVVAVTTAIVISASVADQLDAIGNVGGVVGVSISAAFLFLLAVINSVILYRTLKARKHEDEPLMPTGCLFRLVKPLFLAIDAPWRLYPVGVLFGLGFDTASEIALLGVSAEAGTSTERPSDVLILAFLFTGGMTLVDSVNSVVMLWAYASPSSQASGWHGRRLLESAPVADDIKSASSTSLEASPSLAKTPDAPIARPTGISTLSITLTALSIAMAFVISLIEFMGLAATQCASCADAAESDDGLSGRWWRFWLACNDNSGFIGAGLVASVLLIVTCWYSGRALRRRRRSRDDVQD